VTAQLLQFKGNPKPAETKLVDAEVVSLPGSGVVPLSLANPTVMLAWQRAWIDAFGIPLSMLTGEFL
jgi:hypothetical protein